jgi:hypothetical protein
MIECRDRPEEPSIEEPPSEEPKRDDPPSHQPGVEDPPLRDEPDPQD